MITISLCMIVRDEEATIARCLDTVKDIVDEIVIVDTGSVDKTKEIARQYTSKIYDFAWIDDFSAARNYSFSKATRQYIMWLDADDIVLPEDRDKLLNLKAQLDSNVDLVLMKYNLGSDDAGQPQCTYYRERLFKRSKKYRWRDPVHEYINITGTAITVDIAVTHKKVRNKTERNLDIFAKILKKGKKLSHRNCFYYARELQNNGKSDEAEVWFNKFLAKEGGLFSNYMDACIDLTKIYTARGDRYKAIKALLRCFEFGMPRAEICCLLGNQYEEMNNFQWAINWYRTATVIKKPENSLGSVIHDCYGFIPYSAMSICYFKMGLIKEALEYNEKAAEYKPDSPIVVNNKSFFAALLRDEEHLKTTDSPASLGQYFIPYKDWIKNFE